TPERFAEKRAPPRRAAKRTVRATPCRSRCGSCGHLLVAMSELHEYFLQARLRRLQLKQAPTALDAGSHQGFRRICCAERTDAEQLGAESIDRCPTRDATEFLRRWR